METPADILIDRLGKLRDNGDIDFDHTDVGLDIDIDLQEKFFFIPREEVDAVEIQYTTNNLRTNLQAGDGVETIRATPDDNPNWLYNSAVHALAMYQHLIKIQEQEKEREKLAKRPDPGVYRTRSGKSWFTVIVSAERRIMVPQQLSDTILDLTEQYDQGVNWADWRRIDTTTGTVQP
jgi:hypothetical protein